MRLATVLCFVALAHASLVLAADLDVNNPTGTNGLIMIDKLGGYVRFFDPASFKEISTLTIDGTPHELAIAPDHKTAYVPDYGDGVYGRNLKPGHSIAVIDIASRTVSDTIDVSPYVAPHGLQVDANGMLYASCDINRKLLVIDPKQRRVIAAIDTEGTGHWAAVLPDGSKAYVANKNDRRFVSVIDLKAGVMQGRIAMPNGTQGITVSPDGKHVLALDLTQPKIIVIATARDEVEREIRIDGATRGLWRARYSPNGAFLLVTSSAENTVHILNARDLNGEQRVVTTGRTPFGIAFSADSRTALIGNHGDGSVDVLDLSTSEIISSFKAGVGIEALSYF
jgi:DNA-binding beta-propeller fold protein YncE